jgi:TnpA family transposase
MARHYVLGAADLAIVRARRRSSNRLGFSVQLCVLRYPGRVLESTEVPPEPMLAFVARQIGADPAVTLARLPRTSGRDGQPRPTNAAKVQT